MAADPLAPPMDAPADPLMAPLGDVDPLSPPAEDPLAAPMDLTGEQAGATI
jgi:hypothetical protein